MSLLLPLLLLLLLPMVHSPAATWTPASPPAPASLPPHLGCKFIHADDVFVAHLSRFLGPLLVLKEHALGTNIDQLTHSALYIQHIATACEGAKVKRQVED
jgi:hypothetical protein